MDRGFWWGNLKQRARLVDLDTDGNIILRCRVESLDCICFVQGREKFWRVINAVEKRGFHKIQGISGLAEELVAPQ